MATVRDLIKGSLRLIGAIATGETPPAEELNDGLDALNDMLDSWSLENLLVYQRVRTTHTLTVNDATYTIGSSGDINTTRPVRIEKAAILDVAANPDIELPVKIIERDEYAEIVTKDLTATYPWELYVNYGSPLTTLTLYPVPSAANTLVLYHWQPLTTYSSLSTTLALPPGYNRALRYNLALELAPEYGREPSALVFERAVESKHNLKRINTVEHFLKADPALVNNADSFDIDEG